MPPQLYTQVHCFRPPWDKGYFRVGHYSCILWLSLNTDASKPVSSLSGCIAKLQSLWTLLEWNRQHQSRKRCFRVPVNGALLADTGTRLLVAVAWQDQQQASSRDTLVLLSRKYRIKWIQHARALPVVLRCSLPATTSSKLRTPIFMAFHECCEPSV